jgi:hypothetical protein
VPGQRAVYEKDDMNAVEAGDESMGRISNRWSRRLPGGGKTDVRATKRELTFRFAQDRAFCKEVEPSIEQSIKRVYHRDQS